MALKLGKKPARKGAVAFGFGTYFDLTALPTPPLRIGHWDIGRPWGMMANDLYGCCVWAGAAHEHMMWARAGERAAVDFSDENVLADYAAATGFKPDDPDTDNGSDMADAARYRRRTGIVDNKGVRHTIDAYAAIKPGRGDYLALATWLTGAVGIGLMLPNYALDQFDAERPWEVREGDRGGSAGGHYVSCIGRNSAGHFLVITWGRIHAMSPAFYSRYNDEAICYLELDSVRDATKRSPEGFDEATLRRHLSALGKPA